MKEMPFDHEKMKRLRQANGLSLSQAAALAGMKSKQSWHQTEVGQHVPTLSTIEKIAKALGVAPKDLLK